MTGNRPFHYITATGMQLYPQLLEEHKAGRKPGEIPVTSSDPIEKAIWAEIGQCWSHDPSDRPTAREIRLNLELAGLFRENVGFNEDDAQRERQRIRDQLGDRVPIDLKVVRRIFEELKQGRK